MSTCLALHDRRLKGGMPARPGLQVIGVDDKTPLGLAFSTINVTALRGESIHTLFILCHGYAGTNERARVCMDAGGMGLQLGQENLLHNNVSRWAAIKNKVQNIVVYSCAAGNTERGNEATTADGRYLMGALAIHTNATVYAADRIQWYRAGSVIDFGAWEGRLWQFSATGAPPRMVT